MANKVIGSVGIVIFALLIGLASWSLYQILHKGTTDLLGLLGIQNFYVGNLVIIGIVLILIIIFSGLGFGKSLMKVIEG